MGSTEAVAVSAPASHALSAGFTTGISLFNFACHWGGVELITVKMLGPPVNLCGTQ